MKSWGILISKFRLTALKEAMISMIFHDIPWYPLQLRHSENKSWMKAWTSDRHKLCGKSHCFMCCFPHFDEKAKFNKNLRIWHNLPHLNAKASSFGWKLRGKMWSEATAKASSQLQASDCRLDKSADTGEQTFTSQMLLSTLALDDGLRTALRQMAWRSEKRSWPKRAAPQPLSTVAKSCWIQSECIIIHLQSAHLMFLCLLQ